MAKKKRYVRRRTPGGDDMYSWGVWDHHRGGFVERGIDNRCATALAEQREKQHNKDLLVGKLQDNI